MQQFDPVRWLESTALERARRVDGLYRDRAAYLLRHIRAARAEGRVALTPRRLAAIAKLRDQLALVGEW